MNTLVWQLRQMARRIGPAGLAGLAGLLVALALFLTYTLPLHARQGAQVEKLADLRARAAASRLEPAVVDPTPRPLADLPPTAETADQIGTLERLARAHGITLTRGQYSVTPQTGTSLVRWQITLPIEAPYPALHAWLASALERMPNLVVDEMKLKREQIESAILQADLRLSLYAESRP